MGYFPWDLCIFVSAIGELVILGKGGSGSGFFQKASCPGFREGDRKVKVIVMAGKDPSPLTLEPSVLLP